jgi:ribulose-bisphosphate carboxylase small chain
MWGQPMFDLKDPAAVLYELNECRKVYKNRAYIRLSAFDATPGWESLRLSFLTDRPEEEPGFALQRQESDSRSIRYTTRAYATDKPVGSRY